MDRTQAKTIQMHSTNLLHSISRPIYSCVLTPCKYRSIKQICKRGKTKIYVRHPHTMCNKTKTKNHKVHFMDRTKYYMNFFKNKGPKQNTKCIRHIHSTQSQVSNMCMPTYICGISFERTRMKGT